jgi:nitroimidazol reductase NimA-like FMN-containing flavoprotein (pyridoxamine 5'-phosphate oxidase superfamily)
MGGKVTVESLPKELTALLTAQRVAVLATQNDGQPYCSLMAFAAGLDFRDLYFATLRSTRKYANMAANPQVALLVDDRTGQETDFQKLLAVTATGQVEEVSGPERARGCEIYLTRHPSLSEFVGSPGCALMRMRVEKYYLVSKFQEVHELPS